MDSNTYVEGVLKNESKNLPAIASRLIDDGGSNIRLLHAAMGMATEAGEFLDALKKHVFYGKLLDKTNLVEELGDMFWYLGVASDVLGVPFEEIMQINHNKLFARYSKGFNSEEANNRDLQKERQILENK